VTSVIAFFRRIFAPNRMDGPFWVLWIFALIPLLSAWSIYRGDLSRISPWPALGIWYAMTLGVSLGFHRYFSHKSFVTSRPFQFVLGLLGTASGQTGPLSWSLLHEHHHKTCETEEDDHSTNVGFWHAQGFFLWTAKPRLSNLEDSQWFKYPELVMLEAMAPLIYYIGAIVTFWVAGFAGFVWYWLVPTFFSFNATMLINSVGHGHGFFPYKDYYQPEHCRATNIPWAWPFILGDNWHNNHHAYPGAAAHGWQWWEIDPNRYLLFVLRQLRLVSHPIQPSARQLERARASRATMPARVKMSAPRPWDTETREPTTAE
jgi:stearoyl-CoA desaturase (delta-9 desaturase)